MEYIRQNHSASVAELSRHFFISETSIRRDLQKLERLGLIHKTYGGAVLVENNNEVISLEARQQIQKEAKVSIARKASGLIKDGDVIFLDSSSTALAMVPFLTHLNHLSVITNGLRVANALAEYAQFKVYVLGGLLNTRTFSMRGALACQLVGDMYANHLFVSPKSVDFKGNVYCADEEEAHVRKLMMERSESTILLCSQKKLDQYSSFRLCKLNEVDTIVVEDTPSESWQALFMEHQVQIL